MLDKETAAPLGPDLSRGWYYGLWSLILFGAVANPGIMYQSLVGINAFAWHKYLNLLLVLSLLVSVFLGAAYLATGRDSGSALRLTAAVTIVMFHWTLFSNLDRLPSILGPLTVVAIPAFLIWVTVAHGNRLVPTLMVLVVLAVFVFISVAPVMSRSVGHPSTQSFEPSKGEGRNEPVDVLFVLLDAYGRDDVLAEMYGFDNEPFIDDLGSLGFEVDRTAWANYDRTYATVASIMDLGYPVQAGYATLRQEETVRGLLGQRGSLIGAFRDAGYEVTYTENGWPGSRCGEAVDECWRSGTTMMSAYNLGQMSPFEPVVKRFFMNPVNLGSWLQLTDLADVFGDRADRAAPQMVWAHFILPHPPVRLDGSCGSHSEPWRNEHALTLGDPADDLRRDAYIDQLVCVNSTLLEQLEGILDENPNTAVFLFGDHGPDGLHQLLTLPADLSDAQIRERLGVLLAVREPSRCFSSSSAGTLVTAAREFTACTLGLSIDPIPERLFLVPFQEDGEPAIEVDRALID